MTRINIGIPPEELCDKHLLAELREIKRIPNNLKKGKYIMKDLPIHFTLGKGHEKFFIDKIMYLHKRYEALYVESKVRNFNTTYFGDAFIGVPTKFYNDYVPSDRDIKIIKERINERLQNIRNLRYKGKPV